MTPERAIEILDRIREYSISDTSEALGMAIKALERQLPKEPEKVKEHLYCPICDGFIGYVVDCKKGYEDGKRDTVVHGRWMEWFPPKHMILTGEEMLYRCSSCTAKYSDVEGFRHCPNCGAKMDGKEE